MDIKDFVKTTLKELSEAVEEAKNETQKKIMLTNVSLRSKSRGDYGLIDFDLAVEARETASSAKGGGVKISVLQAHLGKENELISSSVSRIKFTVEANF